jgi:hypothetical protein
MDLLAYVLRTEAVDTIMHFAAQVRPQAVLAEWLGYWEAVGSTLAGKSQNTQAVTACLNLAISARPVITVRYTVIADARGQLLWQFPGVHNE